MRTIIPRGLKYCNIAFSQNDCTFILQLPALRRTPQVKTPEAFYRCHHLLNEPIRGNNRDEWADESNCEGVWTKIFLGVFLSPCTPSFCTLPTFLNLTTDPPTIVVNNVQCVFFLHVNLAKSWTRFSEK
uniref:Uncharacterized protein n=1 Tax=Physcomitrium patens TaxID=3218 RepID=A0A2K1JCQ1_PHYPA|nr:hypothetical protein PHYPA_019567 [Physcomitrium patens]